MASKSLHHHLPLAWSWRTLFLVLLLGIIRASATVSDDDETNYVKLLLRDLDSGQEQQQAFDKILDGKDSVKRHWGISDATTVAGKIFSYPIPDDAFTGKIHKFEVCGPLPAWFITHTAHNVKRCKYYITAIHICTVYDILCVVCGDSTIFTVI